MGLATIGPLISMIGTIGSTVAAVQQRRGAAKAYEVGGQIGDIEAASAIDTAAYEERQARRKSAEAIGKGRAITAAAGVETTSGSPLLAELDAVKQANLEALNIRAAGAREAYSRRYGAMLSRAQGRNIRRGIPGATLGGVSRSGTILSEWAYRQPGTNGVPPYRGGYD